MNILDFFNVDSVDHLGAYRYLEIHGHWPDGFLPSNLEVPPPLWQVNLVGRMADKYITYAIIGKIDGIPAIDEVA